MYQEVEVFLKAMTTELRSMPRLRGFGESEYVTDDGGRISSKSLLHLCLFAVARTVQ